MHRGHYVSIFPMFMRFVESGEGVWLAGFLMASRLTIASSIGNIDGPCIMLEFIKYVTKGSLAAPNTI